MRRQLPTQTGRARANETPRYEHVVAETREDWLTEAEAATYVRYGSSPAEVRLFQRWARRVGVPCGKRGKSRLYRKAVLIAFLEERPWTLTRRHRSRRHEAEVA